MAYNLQSLVTILQQILHPEQTHWSFDHNKPQLESLLEKAESLMQILEKSSPTKVASLDSQIRETAYKAEDIIESQMVHQMLSSPESESLTFPTPDLQQVTRELDSAAVFMSEKTMASSDLTQQIESVKLVEVEEKSASSSRSKSDLKPIVSATRKNHSWLELNISATRNSFSNTQESILARAKPVAASAVALTSLAI
ncbi:putative late blight resistance protein R1A-10 [Salvia divinorum]|uniref:Late blight resistance protein R1A-10 n=1 Tax=Salvia divinorum TaxID=28513 RepID=A0ABD1FIB6_SALDI